MRLTPSAQHGRTSYVLSYKSRLLFFLATLWPLLSAITMMLLAPVDVVVVVVVVVAPAGFDFQIKLPFGKLSALTPSIVRRRQQQIVLLLIVLLLSLSLLVLLLLLLMVLMVLLLLLIFKSVNAFFASNISSIDKALFFLCLTFKRKTKYYADKEKNGILWKFLLEVS